MRRPLHRFGSPAVAPFHMQPTLAGLRGGFGALGISSTATGAAAGAAQGAAAGAVAGPIGAAAGAVVGAALSLFNHQSNPQIQIDKTTALNYFSQYVNVAGTVSGRSIGLNNMDMIFRGACFQGHFPQWGNKTEMPDSLLSMPGSPWGNNDNCFAVLWKAARTGAQAPGGSGANTGNGGIPVRDAKTFVDNYVWPSNSASVDTDPWVTNTDAIGKQIIYDAADAYLATQDPTIPPLIGQTVQTAAPVTLPTVVNPVGSTVTATPVTTTPVTTITTPVTAAPPSASINPVGTTTTATTLTPAQQVATPPAAGATVAYAPDMSQSGTPIGIPAGFVYTGNDPYNQSWILQQTSTGSLYVLWQGALVPYTSTMFAPASTATIATTSAGAPVTQAQLQALVSQFAAQGQNAQQAYTSALQALESSGVAATPAVQSALQTAVATTPAPTTTTTTTPDWVMPVAILGGIYLLTQSKGRRRHA